MALRVMKADERLAETNSKTTVAIFGPPGVGKTSLLWTLLGSATLCVDLEAGMAVGPGQRGFCRMGPSAWSTPSRVSSRAGAA